MKRQPSIALDTNTLIHALKGAGRVREKLLETEPGRVAIPAIVAYELEYGTLRSADPNARRSDLVRVLSVIEILPFDMGAASRTAQLRMELEKKGERIGPHDLLIAGTALAFGCKLITHDMAEFSRIKSLTVEDWY